MKHKEPKQFVTIDVQNTTKLKSKTSYWNVILKVKFAGLTTKDVYIGQQKKLRPEFSSIIDVLTHARRFHRQTSGSESSFHLAAKELSVHPTSLWDDIYNSKDIVVAWQSWLKCTRMMTLHWGLCGVRSPDWNG